ncbi:branched-chain-amino-acid transaminase bat2 [Dimargaris xerosporica]|nr:branched-chain-amino-acid transaminase bat2 [Dimargaris xerosporica]
MTIANPNYGAANPAVAPQPEDDGVPAPQLQELCAANLTKTLTPRLKPLVPNRELVFGKTFSDHMLTTEWTANHGWAAPEIKPYGPLQLEPCASVFHYAFECFEGMKAYKDRQGHIRLFRPDMNMARMNRSVERISLPMFNPEEYLECIKELLRVEKRWIPDEYGYSLYIRPTMIGTEPCLGVRASNTALLYTICCPVGPYYATGFKAISLYANIREVRAWPGGSGDSKIGANYGPSVKPAKEAEHLGCQQVLWLIGKDHTVMEVGAMNLFIYWLNDQGQPELLTPALDGTILPGVTRDSILQLAREWGGIQVTERSITMREIVQAAESQRLLEVFGAGTACIVSPVKRISYLGRDIHIPLDPKDPESQAGPLARRINETLLGIQYGDIPHKWSVVVD